MNITNLIDSFIEAHPEKAVPIQEQASAVLKVTESETAYENQGLDKLRRTIASTTDPGGREALTRQFHDNENIARDPMHPVRFFHRNAKRKYLLAWSGLVSALAVEIRQFLTEQRETVLEAERTLAESFGVEPFRTPIHQHIDREMARLTQWDRLIERHSNWNFPPILPALHAAFLPAPPHDGEAGVDILGLPMEEQIRIDPLQRRTALDIRQQSLDKAEAGRKAVRLDNLKKRSEREASMTREQISAARSRARKNPFHNRLRPGGVQPEPDEDGAGEEVVNEAIK